MAKPRDPIPGEFRILVIPAGDVQPRGGLTIPQGYKSWEDTFRVVADANPDSHGACFWAFTKEKRAAVITRLRGLANFLENNGASYDTLNKALAKKG